VLVFRLSNKLRRWLQFFMIGLIPTGTGLAYHKARKEKERLDAEQNALMAAE